MRVYLAGKYETKEWLKAFRKDLESIGHRVTSKWLDVDDSQTFTDADLAGHAVMDITDVEEAEMLIFCSFHGVVGYKGSCFELGYAMALGMPVVWVGPPIGMVFERLAAIPKHTSWDAFRYAVNPVTLQSNKPLPPMPSTIIV